MPKLFSTIPGMKPLSTAKYVSIVHAHFTHKHQLRISCGQKS